MSATTTDRTTNPVDLVVEDVRQSYPHFTEAQAITHAWQTVDRDDLDGDDPIAEAYRRVLTGRYPTLAAARLAPGDAIQLYGTELTVQMVRALPGIPEIAVVDFANGDNLAIMATEQIQLLTS